MGLLKPGFSNCPPYKPVIKAALVAEGRLRELNLIYLTGVVCVCVFACGAGVGGVAEPFPPAGGKMLSRNSSRTPALAGSTALRAFTIQA